MYNYVASNKKHVFWILKITPTMCRRNTGSFYMLYYLKRNIRHCRWGFHWHRKHKPPIIKTYLKSYFKSLFKNDKFPKTLYNTSWLDGSFLKYNVLKEF